MPIY